MHRPSKDPDDFVDPTAPAGVAPGGTWDRFQLRMHRNDPFYVLADRDPALPPTAWMHWVGLATAPVTAILSTVLGWFGVAGCGLLIAALYVWAAIVRRQRATRDAAGTAPPT